MLFLPGIVLGQKKTLLVEVSPLSYDYGKVEAWENPPAEFYIKNYSEKDLIFLPTFPARDVQVILPQEPLAPGESALIEVRYYTENLGKFSRDIDIYVNQSGEPVTLQIKGEIKSFAPGVLMTCPVSGPKDKDELITTGLKISIVEEGKMKPIPGSKLAIYSDGRSKAWPHNQMGDGLFETQLKYGEYRFVATAEGYLPTDEFTYINATTGILIIELSPIKGPPTRLPVTSLALDPIPSGWPLIPEEDRLRGSYIIPPFVRRHPGPPPVLEPDPEPAPEPRPALTGLALGIFPSQIPAVKLSVAMFPIAVPPVSLSPGEPPVADSLPLDPIPGDLQVTELDRSLYLPNNIIFLIDISLSMGKEGKLEAVKTAMHSLTDMMRDLDNVGVVTYSSRPKVLLFPIAGDYKDTIHQMIDSLSPYGVTYGQKGLERAYEVMRGQYLEGANNQIILATDGLFTNDGSSGVFNLVKSNANDGIKLSVIGFGSEQEGINRMNKLASKGDGNLLLFEEGVDLDALLIEEIKAQSAVSAYPSE